MSIVKAKTLTWSTSLRFNSLMLQALDLYSVPALNAFVRSFARIALA